MDFGLFKAFQKLCKNVAAIRQLLEQEALDRASIAANTALLKESGDALAQKVRDNPAPAP